MSSKDVVSFSRCSATAPGSTAPTKVFTNTIFHAVVEGKLEEHTWTSDTGPLSEHSHKCLLVMVTPPLDKL